LHAGYIILQVLFFAYYSFVHFHLTLFPFQSSLKKAIPLLHADSANAELPRKTQEVSLYILASPLTKKFDDSQQKDTQIALDW